MLPILPRLVYLQPVRDMENENEFTDRGEVDGNKFINREAKGKCGSPVNINESLDIANL